VSLPTAEFCASKTGLAADRQWKSTAYLGLAEIGMSYGFSN